MENTNTIQFADDKAEWFIAVGEKFRGPFKASEVYEKLQSKEVSWIELVRTRHLKHIQPQRVRN